MTKPQLSGVTIGLLLMVLATIILASMHGMVRYAGAEIHSFVLIFYRNFFGLLVVVPLLFRSGWEGLRSSHYHLLVLRGFLGITAMLAWFYSLVHVPLTEATALSFTAAVLAGRQSCREDPASCSTKLPSSYCAAY